MRDKNCCGNATGGNICVLIHAYISKFQEKETHYGARKKQYLYRELNISKLFEMFEMVHSKLRDKVQYSFVLFFQTLNKIYFMIQAAIS